MQGQLKRPTGGGGPATSNKFKDLSKERPSVGDTIERAEREKNLAVELEKAFRRARRSQDSCGC